MKLKVMEPIKIRLENYLKEHFIVKYLKHIEKEYVILREEYSDNYQFEIIDNANNKAFFVYFFLKEEKNLYSFVLNSMDTDGFFEKLIFEIGALENLDELFVTINKKMKKYVLENMYEGYK
jgi:hypothetical protein